MEAAQDMSGQEKENLAGDVLGSLGESTEPNHETNDSREMEGQEGSHDPLYVQKRLKQQKRAHDREMRALHQQIAEMHSGRTQPNYGNTDQPTNPYDAPSDGGNMAEHIHRAVNQVLQHREMEENKIKEAHQKATLNQHYDKLQKHLDDTSDKYDDFDDVVRGHGMPFTDTMRDAALMLPHKGPGAAGEVLYKLGKNPQELSRIANLHPIEQAREMTALSHALIQGEPQKGAQSTRPLGNIKSNPANHSHAINENTAPSEIRARMKAGKFK